MGRPSKKESDRVEELLRLLRIPIPAETACEKVGIVYGTMKSWERTDPEFAARLAEAKADGEVALLAPMRQMAETNAGAARWLLEILYPKKYGRQINHHAELDEQLDFILTRIGEVVDPETHRRILLRIANPDSSDELSPCDGPPGG